MLFTSDKKRQMDWTNESMVILILNLGKTRLQDDYNFEHALRLLPLPEQTNILKRKFRNDQIKHLCNKLLQYFGCLIMVNHYDDKKLGELKFTRDKFGKPVLQADNLNISFSMSNGEEYVCMYIWNHEDDHLDYEVGIDIASTNDLRCKEELELYTDIFTKEEYRTLYNCSKDEIQKHFAHYWSLKESYAKYLGTGLNIDLKKVDIGSIEKDQLKISKYIAGNLIEFQTFWVQPKRQEVISICYNRSSSSEKAKNNDKSKDCIPTIVEISFKELIHYLKPS